MHYVLVLFSHIYGKLNEFYNKSNLNRHAFGMWLFVEMVLVCFRQYFWPCYIKKSNTMNSRKKNDIEHFECTQLTNMETVKVNERKEGRKKNKMLFTIWITYIVWFIDSLSLLLCVCVFLSFVLVYSFRFSIIAIHLHGKHSRHTAQHSTEHSVHSTLLLRRKRK